MSNNSPLAGASNLSIRGADRIAMHQTFFTARGFGSMGLLEQQAV